MIALLLMAQIVSGAQNPPRPPAAPLGTGVIRGRVLRADGRPLPRARVTLLTFLATVVNGVAVPRNAAAQSAETDTEGQYEFTELPAATYQLTALKSGFVTIQFGQRRATDRGQPIKLADGETREHVDIVLPRPGAIAGRVVDEVGDPVEGASVRVLQIHFVDGRRRLADVAGVGERRTNDLGRYRIYGLQPGQYYVSAMVGQIQFLQPGPPSDLPGYAATYFPGTPLPAEAQAVTVGVSQDVPSVDFALAPLRTARIAGTAFNADGDPVGGGLALTSSARSGVVAMSFDARIDPGGKFEFPNVAPGDYVVQAFQGRRNSYTEGDCGLLPVGINGSDVTDLVVRMTRGSAITGRVTLDGSSAIRPVDVDLVPVPIDVDLSPSRCGAPVTAQILDDWTFELEGLRGPRRLQVMRSPPGWALKAVMVNGQDVTDAPLPFGTKEQSLGGVEVVLTTQVTDVIGAAVDAAGRVAPEYSLVLFSVDRERWYPDSRFTRRAQPDATGGFRIRGLPPGEYYLAAVDALQPAERAGDWQDPVFLDAMSRAATKVTLVEGQQTTVNAKLIVR